MEAAQEGGEAPTLSCCEILRRPARYGLVLQGRAGLTVQMGALSLAGRSRTFS